MPAKNSSRPASTQGGHRNTNQDQATTLDPQRRADLHASAITDKTIDQAGIHDDPGGRGWILPWSDGADSFDLLVYDRDKRPDDGRKNDWPKGQTSTLNKLRDAPDSPHVLIVEGIRQSLAAASYPIKATIYGMNGCDGIHQGIADRLPDLVKGKNVRLIFDADWRTNQRVREAATKRVPSSCTRPGPMSCSSSRPEGSARTA